MRSVRMRVGRPSGPFVTALRDRSRRPSRSAERRRGQRERHPGAARRPVLDPAAPALGLDEPARDGEPQPGAGLAARLVAAPEAIEGPPEALLGEPVTRVLDG